VAETAPRQRIGLACAELGREAVVEACARLVEGQPAEEADPKLLTVLAGRSADPFLGGGPREDGYWLRVWGMRGLLWALDGGPVDPVARDAVLLGLGDEHWRVREMAAKVVARHRIEAARGAVTALHADPVPRVRNAAARALDALRADR
jgi:hypothetical protein